MDHIEQCLAELRVLKRVLEGKDKEIATLKSSGPNTSKNYHKNLLQSQAEEIRKYKAENKALKESLRLVTEKRKQDRVTVTKWQQVLHEYKTKLEALQRPEIPTDETRLESSPPRKSATSLTMESVVEQAEPDVDADITLVKEEPKVVDLVPEVVQILEEEDADPPVAADGPILGNPGPEPSRLDHTTMEPPAKRPHIQVSVDALLARDWHPGDFMINPDMNAGISHAYHEKILGKARAHLDCSDCASCKKFQDLTGKKLETSSRHREVWKKQSTPPGFWRSGFDTAAESLDRHMAAEATRHEALERLEHAISSGKYLFKDVQLRELAKKGQIG